MEYTGGPLACMAHPLTGYVTDSCDDIKGTITPTRPPACFAEHVLCCRSPPSNIRRHKLPLNRLPSVRLSESVKCTAGDWCSKTAIVQSIALDLLRYSVSSPLRLV
jgi:hypothetical protein